MKKAILFLLIGAAITYTAFSLQLDIFVWLAGVCTAAGAVTYGYLLMVKRQYDRICGEDALGGSIKRTSTRPAA